MKHNNICALTYVSPTILATLTLDSLSLADLGGETSLDGCDGPSGTARVAGDEVESVLALVELRVGRAAGFAGNIFHYRILLA